MDREIKDCSLRMRYRVFQRMCNDWRYNLRRSEDVINTEIKNYLSNEENLYDALLCEMMDRECVWSGDYEVAIEALGYDVNEFLSDKKRRTIYFSALKKCEKRGTLFG